MKGKFIRILTEDRLELHGLLCQPRIAKRNEVVVLHIHGLAGNFYENRFIDHIADGLTEKGWAFLTANTRGHDYLSDFIKKTDSGLTYVQIGGAHEIFEECIYDLKAWIDFLEGHNYSNVILEGHSTGAIKVAFYQYQTHDERVKGLILMSPSDDIGLQRAALKGKYDEAINIAKQMIRQGKSEELMLKDFFEYPIDAKTYINMFGPSTKIGIFNFHDQGATFEELSSVKCPILAIYGTVKEAVVDNKVKEALSVIKKRVKSAKRCDTAIIEGAPHNYLGHEKEVAEIIKNWVTTISLGI